MTHGCLKVILKGMRRSVFLHTFHTGQSIPLAVERAVNVLADYIGNWYIRSLQHRDKVRCTREEIYRDMQCGIVDTERLLYPPGVSALCIAAFPGLLEPYPPAFKRELRTSAAKTPYVLQTDYDGMWRLFGEDKNLMYEFNAVERLADLLLVKYYFE